MDYFVKILLSFIILISTHSVVSANYTFIDSFDTALPSEWISIPTSGFPILENFDGRTVAHFIGTSARTFTYLGHKSETESISRVQFDFYHPGITSTQGSGVMLTSSVPLNNINPPNDSGNYSVGLWNIGSYYYLLSPACDISSSCNLAIHPSAFVRLEPSTWYRIEIIYDVDSIRVVVNDDVYELEYGNTLSPEGLFIGNSVYTNTNQSWTNFYVDNFQISYGSDVAPVFPYYSQLDPMWASEIYDKADVWATPGQDTIGRWGCAITSVAMMLKNYDINMPTGEVVEPKLLNTWLGSQPDGYVGGGLLNWLAISRLARQSRLSGHGETDLEFVKSTGDASSELTDGHYPILDTFGHFVIAYDQDDTTYSVNDPLTPDDHTQPKSEPLASINTYLPSDTDLSYIMLVTDPDIDLSLPNSQTYIESLVDDISGTTIQKKVVYLQTPTLGDYILDVTDHQSSDQIEVYLYDKLGNVSVDTLQLTSSNPASFVIEYNPDSSDNTVRVNTESILTYLKSLRMPKSPFNGIMQSIYSKFVEYTNNLREGLDTSVIVNDLLKFLSRQSPKHISVETKQAIQNYIMLIEAN